MARSRYDELHDRFVSGATSKAGTRYERLAAIVLKVLNDQRRVIHDLRLLGESEVKHQIDVTIEADGKARRVLVECKDFDISGDPVGLGIIRDFFGVVSDLKPDEAVVVTCNDFTADARKYAAAKGIKLATLREHEVPEGHARVSRVEMTMIVTWPEARGVQFILDGSEADVGSRLAADRAAAGLHPSNTSVWDPVFVNQPDGRRVQVVELLTEHLNDKPERTPGLHEKSISMKGATLEVGERGGIPLSSIVLTYEMVSPEPQVMSWATRVATLIVTGFGDENYVIFEDDLRRFTIGDDGEVIPAETPPSRR